MSRRLSSPSAPYRASTLIHPSRPHLPTRCPLPKGAHQVPVIRAYPPCRLLFLTRRASHRTGHLEARDPGSMLDAWSGRLQPKLLLPRRKPLPLKCPCDQHRRSLHQILPTRSRPCVLPGIAGRPLLPKTVIRITPKPDKARVTTSSNILLPKTSRTCLRARPVPQSTTSCAARVPSQIFPMPGQLQRLP